MGIDQSLYVYIKQKQPLRFLSCDSPLVVNRKLSCNKLRISHFYSDNRAPLNNNVLTLEKVDKALNTSVTWECWFTFQRQFAAVAKQTNVYKLIIIRYCSGLFQMVITREAIKARLLLESATSQCIALHALGACSVPLKVPTTSWNIGSMRGC